MIKIWCLLRDQFAHVKPVEACMQTEAEFIYDPDWDPDKMVAQKPDLVLCVNEFHFDVARCIEAARNAKIPSLVLQDGILEWRCQYENPAFGAGGGAPQHQPVLSDKIACIGAQSARQIAAWGNTNKVEVAGMPRLDAMRQMQFSPIRKPGSRLLVMTAKKPWFDDRQKDITLRSLVDLKNNLDRRPDIEVTWRLTKNVAGMIGVENRLTELSTQELSGVLDCVDAVVTTVSTTILEAMVSKRPVAALDYHNTPRFVQTAWTMSGPDQIPAVMDEVFNPPANKVHFQDNCLNDVLFIEGSAAERVSKLILKMVEFGINSRAQNTSLNLPVNMLSEGSFGIPANQKLDLAAIYPGNAVFRETEVASLQLNLVRAQAEVKKLKTQLESRTIGYWIHLIGVSIVKKLKK